MGTTMVGMARQSDDQPIAAEAHRLTSDKRREASDHHGHGASVSTGTGVSRREASDQHDAPVSTEAGSAPDSPEAGVTSDSTETGGAPVSTEAGVSRRAAGALEAAVLGVLWDAAAALSPGEVREVLARSDSAAGALSYSTVVTILTRLHEKGSLSRERDGRAYRYAPVADEAGLAARRLSQLLDRSTNREAVLSRFVADLSERDEDLLRSLLGEPISAGTNNGDGISAANAIAAQVSTAASRVNVVTGQDAADTDAADTSVDRVSDTADVGRVGTTADRAKKRRGRG